MKRQHKGKVVLAAFLVFGLLATACGGDDDDSSSSSKKSGSTINIGVQDFGESAILGEIYKQALDAKGYKAKTQTLGGFRDLLFKSFDSGDVNLAPDYLASELEFLNGKKGEATSDVDETLGKLKPLLAAKKLEAFTPSDAVDTNAFVVTKKTSEDKGIKTLSDLADKGKDFKLGAPQDCEENAFCLPGLKKTYGLDLSKKFTPLDAGVVATSLENDAINVGVLFSTDGKISDKGFVLLEDDKHMLAADNVLPVLSKKVADEYGDDLSKLLDKISSELTTSDLTDMNKRYDIDKDDAKDIAADWLKDHKLD